jgi:hypothetical protein
MRKTRVGMVLTTALFVVCVSTVTFADDFDTDTPVEFQEDTVFFADLMIDVDDFDQDLIQPAAACSCDGCDFNGQCCEAGNGQCCQGGSCTCRRCKCHKGRWRDLWEGKLEIGINGADGNSSNLNIVAGFDAKREMGLDTITIDVDLLFTRDEDEVTKDRFYSLTRFEHDFPDSNWGWFFDQWFEYDGLEDFRSRLGLHLGGIVTLVKTEDCLFKGLIGLGTSKEFKGSDQDWKPEAFLGSVWEKTINERQKFYIRSVIYPEIGEIGDFRLNVKAGWECALNEEKDLKLSLSAFDRYDSTPSGGDGRNDVDYWSSLIWEF